MTENRYRYKIKLSDSRCVIRNFTNAELDKYVNTIQEAPHPMLDDVHVINFEKL